VQRFWRAERYGKGKGLHVSGPERGTDREGYKENLRVVLRKRSSCINSCTEN